MGGDAEVWKRAEGQRGLITRRDALQLGLSKGFVARRVAKGAWVRVLPGVYRLAGAPEDHPQKLLAATLYARRGSALSGPAAAAVHGFPRLGAQVLEMTSPRNLRAARHRIRTREAKLLSSDVCYARGVLVTTETRTLFDLCEGASESDLSAVVDHLLRTRRTTAESLGKLAARRHVRGIGKLRRVLGRYAPTDLPTESECEAVVQEMLESWGLPRARRQRSVKAGQRWRRLDFAWPEQNVALEVDGFFWHSDPAAFENDRARRNALTAQGWRVFHITWQACLEGAEQLFDQLSPLLQVSTTVSSRSHPA